MKFRVLFFFVSSLFPLKFLSRSSQKDRNLLLQPAGLKPQKDFFFLCYWISVHILKKQTKRKQIYICNTFNIGNVFLVFLVFFSTKKNETFERTERSSKLLRLFELNFCSKLKTSHTHTQCNLTLSCELLCFYICAHQTPVNLTESVSE